MRKITILAAFATIASASILPAQGAGERAARPARPGAPGAMRGPMGLGPQVAADRLLLRGITLDESQRARLQAQRKASMEQRKDRHDGDRPNLDAVREARAKGDTAALRRLRASHEAQAEARRKQHIASLRSILTAAQQAVFDTNLARIESRAKDRRDGHDRGVRRGGR